MLRLHDHRVPQIHRVETSNRADIVTPVRKRAFIAWLNFKRRVVRSPPVVWLKLQYTLVKHRIDLMLRRKELEVRYYVHLLSLFLELPTRTHVEKEGNVVLVPKMASLPGFHPFEVFLN